MKNNVGRYLGTFLIANLFLVQVNAQNAKEVSTKIDKSQKTAFQADYNVPNDLMKTTLNDRFKKAGLNNGKKSKGFTKYEGVTFQELSPNKIDIYTKVEGKKANATVLMLISTGYDNFISTASDPATANNTITFLNKLNEDAIAMKVAIDLSAQQAALKEAEEKLKDSEKEKEKLAKKKVKLEKKMAAEDKTGDKASKEVEAEKLRLENLKSQNAGLDGKN